EKSGEGKSSETRSLLSRVLENFDYHIWGDDSQKTRDKALGTDRSGAEDKENDRFRGLQLENSSLLEFKGLKLENGPFFLEMEKNQSDKGIESYEKVDTAKEVFEAGHDILKAARSGSDKDIDKAQEKMIEIAVKDALAFAIELATEGRMDKRAAFNLG